MVLFSSVLILKDKTNVDCIEILEKIKKLEIPPLYEGGF